MPVNKNALIRYQTLDKCFSNVGRKFFIDDLVDSCNDALYEFEGAKSGVKKRQIYDDIRYMMSSQGWEIPLEKLKDGRRVYYRYENKEFSINKQPVSQEEAKQLKNTILLLERFNGLPHFEWVEEVSARLNVAFNLKENSMDIVSFDSNPYLRGMKFFKDLFDSIYYKKSVEITYKPFLSNDAKSISISPYLLKQYNNRWFLFGYNEMYNSITNLALDRIIDVKDSNLSFYVDETFDPDDFFEDIVGVTNLLKNKVEDIILETDLREWNYIETKPIHGSQRIIKKTENSVVFSLQVKLNKELENLLFSMAPAVKVLSPYSLVETILQRAQDILAK